MLFEGKQLRELIARTPNEIELRNAHGRCCRLLSRDEALALDLDLFVGRKPAAPPIPAESYTEGCAQRRQSHNATPEGRGRNEHRSSAGPGTPAHP